MRITKNWTVRLGAALAALCHAGGASAGVHTWDVNEVFSDSTGQIQFVELWEANGTPGETGVNGQTVTSNTQSVPLAAGTPTVAPTTNKYYLIATAGFAALPGAPTPDLIIPAGSVPFFNTAGDTVAFGGFDSWAFGAVPTNGTDSLDRLTGVGANSPTNYAGVSGSVNGAPAVPSSSWPTALFMLALLAGTGAFAARRTLAARS